MSLKIRFDQDISEKETLIGGILNTQKSLQDLSNDELNDLWHQFENNYADESVPNAIILFASYIPLFKPSQRYQEMLKNTLTKNPKMFFNSEHVNLLFKLLSSHIDAALKTTLLTSLISHKDFLTLIEEKVNEKNQACVMILIKIMRSSDWLSNADLLSELFRQQAGLAWLTEDIKEFLVENIKFKIIALIKQNISTFFADPSIDFENRFQSLIKKEEDQIVYPVFQEIANCLNDPSIPLNMRVSLFEKTFP